MKAKPWRAIFLGAPDFACPSLAALAESGEVDIRLVVTPPDQPKGRGRQLAPTPVKLAAEALGLPVFQPPTIKSPNVIAHLESLTPDILVVVAYGQILPLALLQTPIMGAVNVHPSLLPAYRGPAPINWAIINGETETGVTTMLLDQGLDTGPLLMSLKVAIDEDETAGHLHDRLSILGANLLVETIVGLRVGTTIPRPQPPEGPSQGRLLTKADGRLDWTNPSAVLSSLIRGLDPWPGAHSTFRGQNLKLFGARVGLGRGRPGQVLALDEGSLHVAGGDGSVLVKEFQLAGKNRVSAPDFWRGQRLTSSDFLGS